MKGLPFLIGLVLLYLARKRENDDLAAILANEKGQAGLLDIEMDDLRTWRVRRQTSKRVAKAAGPTAARLFNQWQKEQLKLALVASSVDSEPGRVAARAASALPGPALPVRGRSRERPPRSG